MNELFSKLKSYFKEKKTFLITRLLVVFCLVLFIKINRIQIRLNPPEETFEKVTPVDYSEDRSRLICYARRIPEKIQKVCDGAFPEKGER
ncbi:hypothetical protein [Leptospira santarosai]|uniref:hypothetical protein n=1 Tax=Leptospira santarosai TaxID=28183 RepID=UPI0002BEAC6F|nr:hypothetical protein [Leptospira santarosai]EMO14674.1 hypothetical protein LEP1GSC165_0367 [Leptospira santarosai str. CBC523]EMO21501.1 hypothetical protein LEP1GSC168_4185 [Leptospira santarosai str. HAI134]